MTSKVLVADDSLTIQKVINITLAQSDYELQECLSEDELLKKIETNSYDLILLDFNLSDNNSGYELAKVIKSKNPNAAILVMLGTFDTVDESKFKDYGISDKIIKPFESSKFIKKCSDVLENRSSVNSFDFEEDIIEDGTNFDTDSWVMDAPKVEESLDLDFSNDDNNLEVNDPLTSEMEGWGFKSESLEAKYQKAFPPEINDEATSNIILSRLESSSLELDFTDDNEIQLSNDETDPGYVLDNDSLESLSSSIEEELSADDFWAVDEIIETSSLDIEAIENNNIGEITQDINLNDFDLTEENSKDEALALSFNTNDSSAIKNIQTKAVFDEDAMVARIKNELKPMIEEMIKEFYKQQAERVAWEVIPDLAENIIKKEIKSISESVN